MGEDVPGSPAADFVTGIGLLGIDHVGVAVPDLDAAIGFYQRVFGMRCVHEETNAEQGVREAMLTVGPSTEGGCVQLLAPLSPDSAIGRFLDRNGPGIQQVAYRVADIDAACAALRDRGVRVLYETPKRGTAGSRINFVHPRDAGGVLVELVQQPAGAQAAGTVS
ncbi:methylmalonyl-CoA epimerase [Plantactinospora sp. CA-290183]|uniref:methylmalonyl-CoA epimerase n=1 Tax=Plantactinospora sp. CA-290183 TaxID=3240006 RepID=UPI003D931226